MLDREEDGLLASASETAAARTSETEKSKEEHAGPRRGTTNARRGGGGGPSGGGGEEGKREAREGGGMLRSRGNRLPSERAALSISLHRPGRACCRLSLSLSLSFYRIVRIGLSFSVSFCRLLHTPPTCSSVRHRGPLSGSSPLFVVREEGNHTGRAFSFFPWHPLDRLYRLQILLHHDHHLLLLLLFLSIPVSSLPVHPVHIPAHIYTHTQITPARTLFPRRTAPFFVPDRDSSPISFRSPVIN